MNRNVENILLNNGHPGGLLCDEMGLGKTITCIALLAAVFQKKSLTAEFAKLDDEFDEKENPGYQKVFKVPFQVLIITPAHLRMQWKEELNKWGQYLLVNFKVAILNAKSLKKVQTNNSLGVDVSFTL